EAVIGGDALVPSISAASIVAKVTRDRMLIDLHQRHPYYGFDAHVGYGTPQHLEALRVHGPCEHHRRSFAPVRDAYVLHGIVLPDASTVVSDAAGIDRVFCTPGTAYVWSSKVLRSAMGAHFLLQVFENVEAEALVEMLGVPVVITDSHGAQAIDEADLTGQVAWVFGNEGAGVSQVWRDAAALRVTIPQPGGMESLNVAAAAAVCVFEQCRQQRHAR
ncbi:TrmH family RNA methyltransferase, partial [Paraburkholderia sp. BR14261]